jgi:hypothetical protein
LELLKRAVGPIEGVAQQAGWMTVEVQVVSRERWRALLARDGKFAIDWFRKPDNDALIRNALRPLVGIDLQLEWVLTDRILPPEARPVDAIAEAPQPQRNLSQGGANQRIREAMVHPLVQKFMNVFDGHVVRVDDPPSLAVPPPKSETVHDSERDAVAES